MTKGVAKLTEEQKHDVARRVVAGESQKSLAIEFNVSLSLISQTHRIINHGARYGESGTVNRGHAGRRPKLTAEQKQEIIEKATRDVDRVPGKILAKEYDVSESLISHLLTRWRKANNISGEHIHDPLRGKAGKRRDKQEREAYEDSLMRLHDERGDCWSTGLSKTESRVSATPRGKIFKTALRTKGLCTKHNCVIVDDGMCVACRAEKYVEDQKILNSFDKG